MVLKKQTVWLLTMLTLMVVLSAYYLYNPPVDEFSEEELQTMNDEVIQELDLGDIDGMEDMEGTQDTEGRDDQDQTVEPEGTEDVDGLEEVDVNDIDADEWMDIVGDMDTDFQVSEVDEEALDFFLTYRTERDRERAQQIEEYETVMASSEANAQTVAEANQKMNDLHELTSAETHLEAMIQSQGFDQAVVVAEEEKVNVWVRSDEALDREEVVKIIHMVRDELQVPGNQVYVTYK